ncbi:DUF5682 family protein [Streptosporangium sp. NPDC048865]|uniref:rhamnogalacturonan lyase n=1 Tax=Streptosporangium sp. NPDC048865 TaxID=3155766 RepID=UPI00341E10CC
MTSDRQANAPGTGEADAHDDDARGAAGNGSGAPGGDARDGDVRVVADRGPGLPGGDDRDGEGRVTAGNGSGAPGGDARDGDVRVVAGRGPGLPGGDAHGEGVGADPREAVEALAAAGGGRPYLLGVRHHSPALAAAVPALLDAAGAEVVCVELPADFQAWLVHLADPATLAPVALAGTGGDGRLGFYPFADFSPELAAIRWARERGAEVLCCDLPLSDPAWSGGDAAGGDAAATPSRAFADGLAASVTGREGDDMWDRAVEVLAPGCPPEAVRRAALGVGWALRRPNDAKDNSQSGTTGLVYIDGIRLDGTRLWRINLGRNIRAGAHYTQFQVYDYDGDGRAEVAMKTSDGTVDGRGVTIGNAGANYVNSGGYILTGPEYLTMFNGQTGAAMSTVNYEPPRGTVSSWGDNYGNRVDRFLAGTAYLDGTRPSLIMARGYYTRAVVVAWDFRNGSLTRRWTFDSNSSGNSGYAGQGNHQLSVADVDADGRQEIVYGAATIDDNGAGLYRTGFGHGDALHVGDLIPGRSGLEVFTIHEAGNQPAADVHDARTGQVVWQRPNNNGVEGPGRGVAADVYAGSPGAEFWGAGTNMGNLYNSSGASVGRTPSSANFLAWWDGDPVRELVDQTRVDKYGTGGDTRLLTASGVHSNNGTKATPSLSGDLLGDWREEIVWPTSNNTALRIYSTPTVTTTKIHTLLHDPQYRVALAWQNTAYNQPPHPGFFLGDGMATPPQPKVYLP